MPDGPLPFTPRAMRAEHAALYVGLSASTFHQVVAPAVPPIRLTTGRVAWLREDLDQWLDARKPAVDAPPAARDAAAPEDRRHAADPIAAGLANLRAAKGRARRPNAPR